MTELWLRCVRGTTYTRNTRGHAFSRYQHGRAHTHGRGANIIPKSTVRACRRIEITVVSRSASTRRQAARREPPC